LAICASVTPCLPAIKNRCVAFLCVCEAPAAAAGRLRQRVLGSVYFSSRDGPLMIDGGDVLRSESTLASGANLEAPAIASLSLFFSLNFKSEDRTSPVQELHRAAEMCSAYKEDLLVINLEESHPRNVAMLQGNGPVIVWK